MAIQTRAFDYVLPQDPLKHIITTGESFERMLREVQASKVRIFDYETSGLAWMKHARSVGVALGVPCEGQRIKCFYVPYRHADGSQQLSFAAVQPAIKQVLEDESVLRIAHNLKFDRHIAAADGINIQGPIYDTMVAANIYNENEKAALKHRAVVDLGEKDAPTWESHIDWHIARLAKAYGGQVGRYKDRFGYSEVPVKVLGYYACFDLDFCGRLWILYELKHKLSQIYPRVMKNEMDLVPVLGDMEEVGQDVNVPYLEGLREMLTGQLETLLTDVRRAFPELRHEFEPQNDNQVRDLLVNTLRLPLYERTKSGEQLSVSRNVLEEFSEMDPRLLKLSAFRDANKISTTYTESILKRLDDRDRVHCTFNQNGAKTGRLSSSDPNLQNIIGDSDKRAIAHSGKSLEEGGQDPWSVKRSFHIAQPGRCRIFIDYSQIELRVLTAYCKDPILLETYLDPKGDVHTRTSQEVFGSSEKKYRRMAKVINFGLAYGMAEKGFARQVKIPEDEAAKYLATFNARYKGISAFRERFWTYLRRHDGFFQNKWGRPRRVPTINSRDKWERLRAERLSFGSLIQGTAAELTKESLVRIARLLRDMNVDAYLTGTIHDEIQIDMPVEVVHIVVPAVLRVMTDYPEFSPVSILADTKITTTNWAAAHGLKAAA